MKNQTTSLQQSQTTQSQPYSMTPKAMELAEKYVSRKNLLIALSENECFGDAIMLLSYAMPHTKGILWAHTCVKSSCTLNDCISNNCFKEKQNALNATEKWLNKPSETNRDEMLSKNTIAKPTSATWLTMAAYWSGGSIVSENTIPETVPDTLICDSIYSSVMLSVQEAEEESQLNAYNDAINQGIKILYA